MRSSLIIGEYENCQSKLIEYGNLIQYEGYKLSQVWQSEDDYVEVGINFMEDDRECLFLISDDKTLYLEIEYENQDDTFKLINLWNIIKAYEQKILERYK